MRRPGQGSTTRRRGPEIPEGITGRELDASVRTELRALTEENADRVAQHLVAAGTLLETDPELAFAHAEAAVGSAGRIAAAREAFGIAAYETGRFDVAIRELRTHRRISGRPDNLALIADSERGRQRPEKALELVAEAAALDLPHEIRTELAIVAAGAHLDLGAAEEARAVLEAENFRQPASASLVRLLSAYADVLVAFGDETGAHKWEELARRTARAVGTLFGDEEPDPNAGVEIITIEEEEEAPEADLPETPHDASEDANGEAPDADPEHIAETATVESAALADPGDDPGAQAPGTDVADTTKPHAADGDQDEGAGDAR